MKRAKVTVQPTNSSAIELEVGTYSVSSSRIRLVLTAQEAYLRFTVVSPRIEFAIPVEGLVVQNEADKAAREAVLSYVAAAWAHHQWPMINEWMANEEEQNGLSVWRLRYCHEYEDSPPDPIRQLIEQEVTAWLETRKDR